VTAADVQRVAQTYLVDDQRSVVHLWLDDAAGEAGRSPKGGRRVRRAQIVAIAALCAALATRLRDVRGEARVGAARAARGGPPDRARGRAHARAAAERTARDRARGPPPAARVDRLSVHARRGGRDARRGGAVSFMAELLERGAGKRDALAYAEAVEALGAAFAASADWDTVDLGIAGLSRDFDVLLDLFADAALRPRFDAREAQRARAALLRVDRARQGRSRDARGWHASRTVYGAHRFALPVSGTEETAAQLDAKTRARLSPEAVRAERSDRERDWRRRRQP
jgi:hypothetical protein